MKHPVFRGWVKRREVLQLEGGKIGTPLGLIWPRFRNTDRRLINGRRCSSLYRFAEENCNFFRLRSLGWLIFLMIMFVRLNLSGETKRIFPVESLIYRASKTICNYNARTIKKRVSVDDQKFRSIASYFNNCTPNLTNDLTRLSLINFYWSGH